MSFFGGGGGIGSGQIILGAQTAGLRSQVRAATQQMKADLNAFAAEAQASSGRAASAMSKPGLAAQQSAQQTAAANRTAAASMRAGAAQAEAASGRWQRAFNIIQTSAKIAFLGVAGAVLIGIKAAASFEKDWAGVVKTVGGTAPQMAALREEIRGLAREMPISVNELARIGETAGALGVPIPTIKEFVRVVAMIGSTTNVSTDAAATALGQLGNVLKLRQADYEKFASTLVHLGNVGASTEQQILDIATRMGATARQFGLTTAEILGIASTTASLGIEPEAAGTALQNVFIDLQKLTHLSKEGSADLALLAKTAGLTVKEWKALLANDPGEALLRWVEGIGKLTAPQQLAALDAFEIKDARAIRTVLGLAGNAAELRKQMGYANDAWRENTALQEEYRKGTQNLIDRLKVLWNVIKDELMTAGEAILPTLTKMVNWLAVAIPAGLRTASQLWDRFWTGVAEPVGEVRDAFGDLLDAFGGGPASRAIDWAKTFRAAWDGIINVIATVVRMFARVLDVGAQFARSPLGQFAVQIAGPLIALTTILTGLSALARRLTGWSSGIVRSLAGFLPGLPGFLKGGKTVDPSVALGRSADQLTGSAGNLRGAAASLQQAADALRFGGRVGGAPGAGIPGYQTIPAGTAAAAGGRTAAIRAADYRYLPAAAPSTGFLARAGAFGGAITAGAAAAASGVRDAAVAGRTLVTRTAGALTSGVRAAASGARGIASGLWGGIKGAGSLVARAFWPLMLAELATEFFKEPVADFVRENTPFKNAADKMATDFWGGAVDLLKSALIGTDAWVGHAEFVNIGKAKISTITIAKMGFTSAEIGRAEVPTLENGGFAIQQAMAVRLRGSFGQMAPEDILRLAQQNGIDVKRFFLSETGRGRLGNGVLEDLFGAATAALPIDELVQNAGLTTADLQPIIDELVAKQFDGLTDGLNDAVDNALQKMGYAPEQIEGLPESVKAKIGHLIGANVNGKITDLLQWQIRREFAAAQPAGLTTAADIRRARPATTPARPGFGGMAPGGGLRWESDTGNPFAYLDERTGGIPGGQPGMFGGRPLTTVQDAKDAQAAYEKNLSAVLKPMQDTYHRWIRNVANDPTGNRQVAAESAQAFLDAYGDTISKAKPGGGKGGKGGKGPGSNIIKIVKEILGPEAIVKDKNGVQQLADGAWDTILGIYNQSLWASGQKQRDAIRKTMADIIRQGAKDGSADAAAAMSQLFFSENSTAIAAAISGADQKALGTFLQQYNAANPSAKLGNTAGLEKAFKAWQEAGKIDPTKIADTADSIGAVQTEMQKVADGATSLARALGDLDTTLARLLALLNGGGTESRTGSRRLPGGRVALAGGGFFDTRGTVEMTVGEAGNETVAVLRNPRRFSVPDMRMPGMFTPSLAGASAGGGGSRTTQIFTDKLQVLGPADETSLLARFSFLANT